MRERLRPADYRFLAICLLLLGVTTWYSVRYFHRAFPEASIDFKVNRDQAREVAANFLTGRGYHVDAYRQAARFSFDDDAKTFLEREVGLEQANQIMGSRVRLWRWSNRWFRPQQKEEFLADVSPAGDVVGFEHRIAEADARPSLTPEQARAAAEDFLRTVMHRDPAILEFVEGTSVARPARTDQTFTWKERDFNLKDSTYRVEVLVLGNELAGYREYLKVPEQWQRGYERLRSRNEAAQFADTALTMLLLVGLLVTLVLCVRRHQVRWRRAAVVGIVGGTLFFLSSWNEFPLTEFSYPNTDSYSSFLARQVLNSVLGALAAGGLLFALTAAAEPLYRQAFGDKISLGNLFRPAALRTRAFFLGTVLGVSLTGIFIAYQIAFYMLAYRFGAWSPADVPYSDLLNTRFPWAYVLFGGFIPAVSEEFIFRMFAIPFLRRLARSLWVALIVAGFLWGFGHSGYPQQPFYIRGVEVGIGGVALGLIMVRWGILPTLVWHYSVDAMYSALLLMRSDSLYFKLSALASAGIMVLPAAVALVLYLRNGGFETEAPLTNAAETGAADEQTAQPAAIEPEPQPKQERISYQPWTTSRRIAALALFTAGVGSLLIPVERIGESPRYKLSSAEARAAAARFLREQGANPDSFRFVAFPATRWEGEDRLAGKYMLERRPVDWVARAFHRNRPIQTWLVRFFRPLDKEEYLVAVHPETGRMLGFNHALPEDRPGADLDAETARSIAATFAGSHGWELSNMELKESSSEKQKARRDYALVWEARPGDPRNLDEARYRVHVDVAGDRVSATRTSWKIPETFVRERGRQNAVSIAISVIRIAVISLAVVFALIALINGTRHGTLRWGGALRLAVPFTLLAALNAFLMMPQSWRNYSTAMPPETFQTIMAAGAATSLVFLFLLMCIMAAFLQATVPESLRSLRAGARFVYGLDAVLAVLLAIGLAALSSQSRTLLLDRFHAQAIFGVGAPEYITSLAPAVSALSSAVRSLLTWCAVLALAAHLMGLLRRRSMVAAVVLVAVIAEVPGDIRTLAELAVNYAATAIPLAAVALFAFGFARSNYLAYVLAAWTLALRGGILEFFQQPNPALQMQGWLLVVVLAATLLWAARPALRSRTPPAN